MRVRSAISKPRKSSAVGLSRLEIMLTLIVAVPLLGTFFPYESYLSAQTFANPLGIPVEIGRSTTLCLIALYGLIIWLYASNVRMAASSLTANWQLFVFTAWVLITALWSDLPTQSFNRSGRILLCALFGVFIARALDRPAVIRIMCYAILIGMIGSALVTVFNPNLSRMIDTRVAWRGAFQHKNVLGSISAFGIMFGVYAYSTRSVSRYASVALVLSGLVFLALSNSLTSVVAFILASGTVLVLLVLAPRPNSNRMFAVIVIILLSAVGAFIFAAVPTLFEVAGRDLTLTGRTEIWDFAGRMIELKPMFGWGHGVWSTQAFQLYARETLGWGAPAAHNTWIDFRLQLGLVGFLIACLLAFSAVTRAIWATLRSSNLEYLVWVAVLIFEGIRCNTETMYLDPGTPEMLWFAIAFARLPVLTEQTDEHRLVYPKCAPRQRAGGIHSVGSIYKWANQPSSNSRPGAAL